MIIDFHVHAFADKIAERAMDQLTKTAGMKPFTNGTLGDLIDKMNKYGVDKAVLLPIATKPSQQQIINGWAKEVMSDRIISFGSIHPEAEDALEELERIKELGLYGIKLHPDYQDFMVDEERVYPVYSKCVQLGLPIVFHAGFDPLSPELIHGMPYAFARVFDAFPDMTMVLAHFGGMYKWDLVEKYLAGKPGKLYFDISTTAGYITDEQAERIIRIHGADRILFASDLPWSSPEQQLEMLNRLNLSDEEKENILYKNAIKLLGSGMEQSLRN